MKPTVHVATALSALLALTGPAIARAADPPPATTPVETAAPAKPDAKDEEAEKAAKAKSSWTKGRPISMQYLRAQDKRGLNVFETTKDPGVEFTGVKLDVNAAFTSQLQWLDHHNTAVPVLLPDASGKPYNSNQLADIGFGFNTATANLAVHAQLAPGIRVQLTSYLSSRHHNETWVKDGYIQIDEWPMEFAPLQALMKVVTVKVGHMEINYGDAHFRRTDNGNSLYNPFVGNYIMDAFTTEIGGEVYLKAKNIIAMGSITGGEIRGTVLTPEKRGPAFVGKLGFDRQMNKDLRVRLTGSLYTTDRALSNTLYGGDRAGSRYYYVLENVAATETAQKDSGLINPGFKNKVDAVQVNPFVKYRGLEVFGVIERADGRASTETSSRTWRQNAVDVVYRFFGDEKLFVGTRYNKAKGELVGIATDVGADRWQFSGGWFILPGLLAKAEYVNEEYFGYPDSNIKNGGRFHGVMLEGVVAF